MVKVLSFSSGVRTKHVFGWGFIIWFASAVGVVGSQGVKLQVKSQVVTECGKNVTLTCNASSLRRVDIQLFSWLARNKTVCQYGDDRPDPEVQCESMVETSNHTLALMLSNVMPVNRGKYLCKLRSKLGVSHASTFVTVQDCLGKSGFLTKESNVNCWFHGVYPSGTVHWFQGGINLTDSASTEAKEDQNGRYNILSSVDIDKGNVSLPYTCSLWIHSGRKYLSSQHVTAVQNTRSSGSMVKLQWICIMVEIMMAKFII